ncbi:MAG: hypothetical protein AB7G13_01145 [Lautropia sp.]
MHHAAIQPQELNPAKLTALFRKQLQLCNVRRGETIAVVSDLGTRREYVQSAFAAADDLEADIYEMCVNSIPSWTKVGIPTVGKCKGTLEAAKAADLIVIFHVPLFARWLKDVRDVGVRVLMVIDAPDELEQLMAPPGLKEAVLHAHARLERARDAHVTTPAGTDLRYRCGEYPVMSQYGYADAPGRFDHWGAGHVHTFPNEGSATGTVVISPGDIVILPFCRYVQDRVEMEVVDGIITRIDGGLDAKLMREWLDDGKDHPADQDPYAVSHLGWGLNPQAKWYGMALNGEQPERSRALARVIPGSFLFSTGPNSQGGGKRTTRGHLDIPLRDCTLKLDGETIIRDGNLADPRMRVTRERR